MKKHTGKFNVKLYRYLDGAEEFTVLFPFPKWLREKDGYDGLCIACDQATDGTVIRFECFKYHRNETYLGRRYPLEKMSPVFQSWVRTLEILYHDALHYDDEEHWDAFNRA